MDLTEAREKIDRIDDQITDLYGKRMELSREIGIIKDKENKNVDAPEREKAIVNRLAAKFPDEQKVYVKQLYNTIFYTSKAYQNRFIHLSSPAAEAIKKPSKSSPRLPFPRPWLVRACAARTAELPPKNCSNFRT